jgi:hypothetical protein
MKQTKYRGTLIEERLSPGSKSERMGVLLHTDAGDYLLRRIGANAFRDEVLRTLLGSVVEVMGFLKGSTIFLESDPRLIDPRHNPSVMK